MTNPTLIGQFADCHRLISARTCSRDDRIFLLTACQIGFNSAVMAACGFGWKCLPIIDALRRFLVANHVPESELIPVYDKAMKSESKPSPESDRFTSFMKRLVAVPHSEIKAKLDAEKRAKQRKKRAKTSPASRASDDRED